MLDLICEKLGIEVGEKWTGNDGKTYMIDNKIVEWYEPNDVNGMDYEGWVLSSDDVYKKLLLGELKPIWKPKPGDYYWLVDLCETECVWKYKWYGTDTDNIALGRNLLFQTKDEAIEVSNKMLSLLQEDE